MPQRIQLSRRKGWRKPENTVVVARPSKWGNPFRVGGSVTRADAVRMFEIHAVGAFPFSRQRIQDELAGKNLACWCPLEDGSGRVPCHADVLLEIANS